MNNNRPTAFSFAANYNRERLFPDVPTDGLDYYELPDIFTDVNQVFVVEAIYINTKGLYEDRPCLVVTSDESDFRGYVNLPSHLTDVCREILKNKRAVQAIKDGHVGFTIYTYEARKYSTTCYSINWVDIK